VFEGGSNGKILRINLTEKSSKAEELPPEIARDFIGEAGFGVKSRLSKYHLHLPVLDSIFK
jgi:aldehyde:ferredoxin oxidoreductase